MKIELTAYTPSPLRQMYLAAKRCTTATLDVNEEVDREEMERVVRRCIKSGHLTVAEFVDFTFSIEGITRSCSHQLVRHRHASFCQMSERRVVLGTDEDEYYVNEEYLGYGGGCCSVEVEAKEALEKLFGKVPEGSENQIAYAFLEYRQLIKNGVPVEQARAILPECTLTNLMMSANFRELMHICALRMCQKAEEEIRELVTAMASEVSTIPADGPFLYSFLKPKCFQNERCTEAKPCGVYKWNN